MFFRVSKYCRPAAVFVCLFMWVVACAAQNSVAFSNFQENILVFERSHSISGWPSETHCNPASKNTYLTEGFVLEVYASQQSAGIVYGDSLRVGKLHCHAKIRYELQDWPVQLKSGYYIVAARREGGGKKLKVLAIYAADDILPEDVLSFAAYLDVVR